MNAWGVKKVGRTIGTTITDPVIEVGSPSTVFRRPSTGTGSDERSPEQLSGTAQDAEIAQLVSIDKSFRQLSLMKGLTGGSWSQAEQLKRIQIAANVDGLLPSSSISAIKLSSGGLMNDWDFE